MTSLTADKVEQGRRISLRLHEEADRALRYWATVEANRLAHEPWRPHWRPQQTRNLALGAALRDVVQASLEATLLILSRMTDPTVQSDCSLFHVPSLLSDDVVAAVRGKDAQVGFDRAVLFFAWPCVPLGQRRECQFLGGSRKQTTL